MDCVRPRSSREPFIRAAFADQIRFRHQHVGSPCAREPRTWADTGGGSLWFLPFPAFILERGSQNHASEIAPAPSPQPVCSPQGQSPRKVAQTWEMGMRVQKCLVWITSRGCLLGLQIAAAPRFSGAVQAASEKSWSCWDPWAGKLPAVEAVPFLRLRVRRLAHLWHLGEGSRRRKGAAAHQNSVKASWQGAPWANQEKAFGWGLSPCEGGVPPPPASAGHGYRRRRESRGRERGQGSALVTSEGPPASSPRETFQISLSFPQICALSRVVWTRWNVGSIPGLPLPSCGQEPPPLPRPTPQSSCSVLPP